MRLRSKIMLAAVAVALSVVGAGTAQAEPSQPAGRVPGACFMDTTNATTGEWHEPVFACVPLYAPDGTQVTTVWEDGAGTYGESQWYFDPEQYGFESRL